VGAETQTVLAVYLYGFTLFDAVPDALLGIDNEQAVHLHHYANVNAIISTTALANFTGELGESNLQNVAWLAPRAYRHAQVIDQCMINGAVYPLPFGTLFSNINALEQEMLRRSADVLAVLKQITGCQEWALEATLDRKQAVDTLLTDGLSSGRFSLPDSVGRRHLEEQKLRRTLTADLNDWLIECLTTLQAELQPFTQDFRTRRLVENKVMNWAYLLPVEQVDNFQQQVEDISRRYDAYGFNFRVTGPWAAYSFCQAATPS
jgi:hypothetical protein